MPLSRRMGERRAGERLFRYPIGKKVVIVFCRNFPYNHEERSKEVRSAGDTSCRERQTGVIMNSNEWQQLGEDIKEQVQSAIDSGNFSGLSRTISDTVSQAIGDVGKSMNDAMNGVRESFQQTIQKTPNYTAGMGHDPKYDQNRGQDTEAGNGQSGSVYGHYAGKTVQIQTVPWKGEVYYGKPNLRPDRRYFVRRPKGSVSGILQIVFGFGISGIMGILFSLGMLALLFSGETGGLGAVAFLGALTAGGFAVGMRGVGVTEQVKRFKRYVSMVQEKLYCSIEDLTAGMGRNKKFVLKDLKKMMRKGWFLQGHLDKQESCFIVSDQVYEQYRLTQQNYEEDQRKRIEDKAIDTDVQEEHGREEYDKILEEGRAYIQAIRRCNEETPGEEMSEKLNKLELLVTRIFAQVEKEPELAQELHKMLNYYLPTTQKLLEAYRDLEKQNVEVSNISKTKKEIEAAVDTINQAFEKFLDELFREKAWDIQTDISVLNTMLKQDGYLNGDFEKK